MPGTFSDSWKLTKTAFRLIGEDRALLVFPIVGGLSILAVFALLVVGVVWLFPYVSASGSGTNGYVALGVGMFLAAYFVATFISVYATAGLVAAATLKLGGQQPTAADGWRVARARVGRLATWAIISASVGLVIQLIASRVRGIAGMVIGLAGGATWALISYFMIPVVLYEDTGAWASLKRSGHLFVSTLGRTLVSNLVIDLIVGGGIFAGILIGVYGIFLLTSGAVLLGVVLIGVALTVATIFALIGATAEGILRAALYRYATTGKIEEDLLPGAYRLGTPPAPGPPLP